MNDNDHYFFLDIYLKTMIYLSTLDCLINVGDNGPLLEM